MRRAALYALVLFCIAAGAARADSAGKQFGDEPWSLTFYTGPSSSKWFFAVFSSGRLQPDAVGSGLALDYRLFHVTSDLSIMSEAHVLQTYFGHANTNVAGGLGFQWNEPFGFPYTSFSGYDGLTYASDPSKFSLGYGGKIIPATDNRLLNYMSVEWTAAFSKTSKWDLVFRFFHSSGAFGLVTEGADAGMTMGIGVRRRF